MTRALHVKAKVLSGHRVEIVSPELPEGDTVEVFVVLPEKRAVQPSRTVLDYLDALPDGPRLFKTPEEVDQYLQEERYQWDR